MKKLKRGLALLLTVLMLITTLPATAMAAELEDGTTSEVEQLSVDAMMATIMAGAVMYMDGETAVLVVEPQYADWCQENWEMLSKVGWFSEIGYFDENDSYTIQLEPGTAFPYKIAFLNKWDDDPMVTFASVDDVHEVNGHTFRIFCENPQVTETGDPDEVDYNVGVNPLGYQYIETITKSEVDLTGYLEEELKVLPLTTLLPDVDLNAVSALAVDTATDGNGNGQYEVVKTEAETIDLSGLVSRGYYYDRDSFSPSTASYRLEIINSDDQLNTDATRYIVPVRLSYLSTLLDLDAYLNGTQIDTGNTDNYWYCSNGDYQLHTTDGLPVWDVRNTVVSMKLNAKLNSSATNGLTARVYEGTYLTADEVDSTKEITDRIWNKSASGYNTDWTTNPAFTVVLERNGKVAQVINLTVRMNDKGVDFGFDMSTVAVENKPAEKIDVYVWNSNSYRDNYYNVIPRNYDTWQSGKATLKLRYKTADDYYSDSADYSDYVDKTDVTIYTGYYENETALMAAVNANQTKDITSDIWAADGKGHTADYTDWTKRPAFTAVVKDKASGKTAYVVPFYVYMSAQHVSPVQVSVAETLYVDNPSTISNSNSWNQASETHTMDRENGTNYYTMRYTTVQEVAAGHNYPTNGKYYVQFMVSGGTSGGSMTESLAKISRIEDKDGNDVKAALLGEHGYNYYQVDFSQQPVVFTVYFSDAEAAPQEIRLRTLPAQPPEKVQSIDTYFNVTGVDGYDTYTMPYHVDSSYQNGFQVIFVNTTVEELESKEIKVTYSTGSSVKMFWRHDEQGERIETASEISTSVKSGEPVLFSAASESGTHLRNYWITFIAKQAEAKLWINGQDDKDHVDKGTGLPLREVFIYNRSGYYDIFFANIGGKDLTGLAVSLTSQNNNIRLDEYWTVGDTKTLAGFTTTSVHQTDGHDDYYSQLENMAKIRLWAEGQGEVDGTLTITADGQEPISIKLTGKVGQAAILSSKVPDGVKYVPYSCLIQHNYAGRTGNDTNRPTFRIVSGTLPSNVSINEKTGEIYGVPRASGIFNFTVGLYQNGQMVDSRSFTMNIKDNTDENVWKASDETYNIVENGEVGEQRNDQYHYVIDLSSPVTEDLRTFVSEGPYLYYVKVFLDSKLLTPGVDYISSEGSTKIVLSEDTVGGNGNNTNGSHTLAIEFRENDSKTVDDQEYQGTLKRTSQNYYIEGGINPSTPQQPSDDNSGSTSENRPSSSVNSGNRPNNDNSSNNNSSNNQTPSLPSSKTFPFVDVKSGDWYYNDVFWAWDHELMTGVTNTTFAPNTQISQAMIVVTLARLINVDLTAYESVSVIGAAPGMWYTTAAAWAQQSGLLPDYTTFDGENGAYSRDGMAIMLMKYLASMGVDITVGSDIAFDDMDQMTDAGRNAFRVLCHYGIFKGIGNNKMDPSGVTTRAQFATLLHRISDFVASR